MFGRFFRRERGQVRDDDARLDALLHEWKGMEPGAHFESTVWRRVRRASAPKPVIPFWRDWLIPAPAWVSAMAAMLGILVGVWSGFSVPAAHSGHAAEPLLHAQTLAGSYLAMVTGDAR